MQETKTPEIYPFSRRARRKLRKLVALNKYSDLAIDHPAAFGRYLQRAILSHDGPALRAYVAAGLPVDAPYTKPWHEEPVSELPLTIAARVGDPEVVSVLLSARDAPRFINTKNYENETALEAACRCGNTEVVRLLLQHGAAVGDAASATWTGMVWDDRLDPDTVHGILEIIKEWGDRPDVKVAE